LRGEELLRVVDAVEHARSERVERVDDVIVGRVVVRRIDDAGALDAALRGEAVLNVRGDRVTLESQRCSFVQIAESGGYGGAVCGGGRE
jgi:hypothetical protein